MVGCITLAPACTLSSATMSSMAVGPKNLVSTIAPMPALVVAVAYTPVLLLLVKVGTPNSSTALPLPSVGVGLMSHPAVI